MPPRGPAHIRRCRSAAAAAAAAAKNLVFAGGCCCSDSPSAEQLPGTAPSMSKVRLCACSCRQHHTVPPHQQSAPAHTSVIFTAGSSRFLEFRSWAENHAFLGPCRKLGPCARGLERHVQAARNHFDQHDGRVVCL